MHCLAPPPKVIIIITTIIITSYDSLISSYVPQGLCLYTVLKITRSFWMYDKIILKCNLHDSLEGGTGFRCHSVRPTGRYCGHRNAYSISATAKILPSE